MVLGSFMRGIEIVRLAEEFDWSDDGPGANHPFILKRPGARRPIPVRDRIENRKEAQGILRQLGIPRDRWSEKCK